MPIDETTAAVTPEANSPSADTGASSSPSQVQSPEPARGRIARVWDWFWRGHAMRSVTAPIPAEREALRVRAHLAADVARRTEDSAEPFDAPVDALLCDLYRQSIYWSRCAFAFSADSPLAPKPFAELDSRMLQRAVPDAELLVRAQSAAEKATFQELALLPEEERVSLVGPLRAVALAMLSELDVHKRALEALWTQRLIRVGLIGVLLVIVAFVGLKAFDRAEEARDLAAGKPWRTSSAYAGVDPCRSPDQDCTQSPDFFFHTLEEHHPWVEFDLGRAEQFSAVRVENRKDCCQDRAVPLVIEISSDHAHWRQLARRDTQFTSWLATFDPVSARYLRVRLDRRESLHLRRVRVLR